MAADTTLTSQTWLVAIDIGKAFHAVLVEGGDGKRQQFRMANHVEDYDRLVVFLRGLPGPARIALEPTGDFHRTLAHRLLREGFSVVSVSSVAGARYREALFNSWDKNDPKDAHVILQLLKHGLVQHELAQRSIALPVAVDSVAIETFRLQLAQLRRLAELRQTLEARAHALLKERADFQRLCSLPGVAAILALVILAESGDLRRFPHHRQFLKYCGLDLAKCQSGQFRERERLSKRGNARLRMAFWMAAQRAVPFRATLNQATSWTYSAPLRRSTSRNVDKRSTFGHRGGMRSYSLERMSEAGRKRALEEADRWKAWADEQAEEQAADQAPSQP